MATVELIYRAHIEYDTSGRRAACHDPIAAVEKYASDLAGKEGLECSTFSGNAACNPSITLETGKSLSSIQETADKIEAFIRRRSRQLQLIE